MPGFVNPNHSFPKALFAPTVKMEQMFSSDANVSPDPYDHWSAGRFCKELLNRGVPEKVVTRYGDTMFWKVACFPSQLKKYLVLVDRRDGYGTGCKLSLYQALIRIKELSQG